MRVMPWVSTPRRFESTSPCATTCASLSETPAVRKMAAVNARRSFALKRCAGGEAVPIDHSFAESGRRTMPPLAAAQSSRG